MSNETLIIIGMGVVTGIFFGVALGSFFSYREQINYLKKVIKDEAWKKH